jgi:gluconate 5-dehydrogenase
MTAPDLRAFELTGHRALVTGASVGGLGHRFALALARAGADVVLLDRPGETAPLEQAADEVRALGRSARTAYADVTDESALEAVAAELRDAGEDADILVNAAGIMLRKPAFDTAPDEWRRVVDVNLFGTWLAGKVFAKGMAERGWGRVINISTQYAASAGPMPESSYYASKAGVANLTRSLAGEWAPHGVTVNCLAPGAFYPTRMTAGLANDPGRLESIAARTMLGRLGDVTRDLDGPIVFLASEASAYMTGSLVYVDGGWTAW